MTVMRARRLPPSTPVALVAALALAPAASAHARVLRTAPAAGAVLATAPAAVRVTFDDVVKIVGRNEVVPNVGGPSVAGEPRLEKGGTVLVLPLRSKLGRGDYTVLWEVLSDDGHRISGVFAFAVGKGRAPPSPVLRAASTTPSAEQVAARWLLFAGLLLAAGAAAFWLLVVRKLPADARSALAPVERPRFAATVLAGSVLFLAGSVDLVRGEGWDTRFGLAYHVALIVAAVCAIVSVPAALRERFRVPLVVLALAFAAAPSFAGHALDPGVPWPNVAVDLVHVAAAAVWIGGLAGLVLLVPVARGAARELVLRVSTLALASIVLLVATGVVRAVFELRSISQLATTGYGRAILVKVALLAVLTVVGWLNRRSLADTGRVRRRAVVELVLLAGVLVAVGFLTQLRPGRDAPGAAAASSPLGALERPPAPPPGTLVLAREDGRYAVALAAGAQRLTAIVLDPSGGGAVLNDVRIAGAGADACGRGCYAVAAPRPLPRDVPVSLDGRTVTFALPRAARPAAALLRRATRAFHRLRSVRYRERLSSGLGAKLTTIWSEEAPDRISYAIAGGPQAIVIGGRRWDRSGPGKPWTSSETTQLVEPTPIWEGTSTNAFLVRADARAVELTWASPSVPAFFDAVFDRRTLLPRTLRMTAAAHFMHHDYLEFNRPLGIRPPAR